MQKPRKSQDHRLQKALDRHRAGDFAAAARLYDRILDRDPGHAQALHLRATLYLQQQRPERALPMIEKALKRSGQRPELLLNRSSALLALDRPADAARDAEAVASIHPRAFGAWLNLGLASVALEQWQTAAAAFSKACRLRPDDGRCQVEWRIAELRRPGGHWHELPDALMQQAANLSLELAELIRALAERDQLEQAAQLAMQVFPYLEENPDDGLAWINRIKRGGLPVTASKLAENLCTRHPEHLAARLFLATELQTRGLAARACEHYRALLEHHPDHWQAHSNYLIALQLDPNATPEQIEQAHQQWANQHAPAAEPLTAQRGKTPLRIGWFTPRLLAGPMTAFFAAVLEAFPRDGVEHWLYQCHPAKDPTTARFAQAADRFIDASELDDDALVKRAREDGLDLVMDLSGHAPHHRLRSFARRLAPAQLSWLDYFHPTGIAAIDGFISDPVLESGSADAPASSPLLLPRGRLCYAPVSGAPAPASAAEGPVQIACFNRSAKISDPVLAIWARILDRVPEAELLLRCHQFDQAEGRRDFIDRAGKAGIAENRVKLKGWSDHLEVLAAYNRIDLALDTFPFSGCATSADALFMGVPVISLMGQTRVGRQTASLLYHAGFDEWVGQDAEDYVERAVRTALAPRASTEQRLARQRQFLTQVGDCPGFAADLEARLRSIALDIAAGNPHLESPRRNSEPAD